MLIFESVGKILLLQLFIRAKGAPTFLNGFFYEIYGTKVRRKTTIIGTQN